MNELEVLNDLFAYNLEVVAKKFGLIDIDINPFPINKATFLLNVAEEYSFKPSNEDKTLSLIICAILWENREENWTGLSPFISNILIRLGLGTTAKMVGWDKELNVFHSLGSLIDELYATVRLNEHEIIINNQKIILSDFQKRMWDLISTENRIGISAPTSAGKSFVLVNKALETLSKEDGKIVFIVPTISLIHQVSNDLRKKAKEYGLHDIYISQTVNDISLFKSSKIVYVLTQERAFSALSHPDADLDNLKLLIIDEIQNIEKVPNENEERAKILLDVIQEFKNDKNPEKIVISGPRLSNIGELVKKWFGETGKSVSEDLPSVVNVTYSFRKPKRKPLEFVQYLPTGHIHTLQIVDNFNLSSKILNKVRFNEDANKLIASLIQKNKSDGNIVFSDTTRNANEIALAVAGFLDDDRKSPHIDSLKNFIATSVHKDYSLIQAIDKGVSFHHSKMPQHIRSIVEKAFSKRYLNTIVSTTTLMQGINLPAKNIIIRNPRVGQNESLTGYEFTNLKGRAGRLMQDFVGRAIIIDEDQCKEAAIQLEVVQQKELLMGYGQRFEKEKQFILETLNNHEIPSNENNGDLIVYIRNMCLKYGEDALQRIREVGINIEKAVVDTTVQYLENLSVPKSICFNNFYWDPLLLDSIYKSIVSNEWIVMPNNIVGCTNDLLQLLMKMHEVAPAYYKRYIDIDPTIEASKRKVWSLCIYAEQYGSGKPLKDVINPTNFPISSSEDIDNRISDIHTKVVFGIPKLLRPVFNINDFINKQNTSQILSFIEVGAMSNKLRALIEIGVPRETAIYLLQNVGGDNFLDSDGKINSNLLADFIKRAKENEQISMWHKLLIEEL